MGRDVGRFSRAPGRLAGGVSLLAGVETPGAIEDAAGGLVVERVTGLVALDDPSKTNLHIVPRIKAHVVEIMKGLSDAGMLTPEQIAAVGLAAAVEVAGNVRGIEAAKDRIAASRLLLEAAGLIGARAVPQMEPKEVPSESIKEDIVAKLRNILGSNGVSEQQDAVKPERSEFDEI